MINFISPNNLNIPKNYPAHNPRADKGHPFSFKSCGTYDTVSFSHKPSFRGKFNALEPSLGDFLTRYKNRMEVFESIKHPNQIGEGMFSKVFKFSQEKFDKYVIKVIKSKGFKLDLPLNAFPENNFGQPISQINSRIFVLKKSEGVQHSLKNWRAVINNEEAITLSDARAFSKSIEAISEMPESSFVDFASNLKVLKDKGYRMDSMNPNNLMIDYSKNRINIIDIAKQEKNGYKDNDIDMIVSLLDMRLYPKFAKLLPPAERMDFIYLSNVVAEKCHNAAVETGLGTDKAPFMDLLSRFNKYFKLDFNAEFREFSRYVYIL